MPNMLASHRRHTCRQVAVREGANLTYLCQDHLGSAAVAVDASTNRAQYLQGATTGCADALNYGARWYDPITGRFLQADTIVPEPGNPQSLNRYAYCLNNPLKYTDPTGHDPLGEQWQNKFHAKHGWWPTPEDCLIRLFSIAYPGEWDESLFYDSNNELIPGVIRDVIRGSEVNPVERTWAGVPEALENLSKAYSETEGRLFTRDIGTLYGDLANRIEVPEDWSAISNSGNPIRDWAAVSGECLGTALTGSTDFDKNIHHWAWAVTMGGSQLGTLGIPINAGRELTQKLWLPDFSDIWIGTSGTMLGVSLSAHPYDAAAQARFYMFGQLRGDKVKSK